MFKDKILKLFETANNVFPGTMPRGGISEPAQTPTLPNTNHTGQPSLCPSFPMQGNQAIHEDTTPIVPLQVGDLTIQAYLAVENNTPTSLRYKVIKNGVPLPVDLDKQKSKNIGHTSQQVLKKLSLMPNKIQLIKQFINYDKTNTANLKQQQQQQMGTDVSSNPGT